jgi:hypothetical protein
MYVHHCYITIIVIIFDCYLLLLLLFVLVIISVITIILYIYTYPDPKLASPWAEPRLLCFHIRRIPAVALIAGELLPEVVR